ncbi:MAG: PEP-CTERM sorting domain-containing protein [Acidobacteria bacterium]|nr:PEP-CTERM sorting domain-containing protein [Acidobacteriota bacterium]
MIVRNLALAAIVALSFVGTAGATSHLPSCNSLMMAKPEVFRGIPCAPGMTLMVQKLNERGDPVGPGHAIDVKATQGQGNRWGWNAMGEHGNPNAGFQFDLKNEHGKNPKNHIEFDTDPFIEYAFGVKAVGGDLLAMFVFSTFYTGGPYDQLQSSHSSSVTDGAPRNGAINVMTTTQPEVHHPMVDGVYYAGTGFGDGCALTGPDGFSDTCDPSSNATVGIPPTPGSGILSIIVKFKLSKGDLISLNGRAELLRAVPEPATFAMAGAAVLCLGLMARRLRK